MSRSIEVRAVGFRSSHTFDVDGKILTRSTQPTLKPHFSAATAVGFHSRDSYPAEVDSLGGFVAH
jgi:hypothetical protein